MPRKPPKLKPGESREAELAYMRAYRRDEDVARRKDAVLTMTEKQRSRSQIEEFIRTDRIAGYPVIEADLKEEATLVYVGGEPLQMLIALIESAITKSARPPPLVARTIAGMLLGSYDELSGCNVQRLPPAALSVPRLLAHVVSLPVRLEPRVAIAVARRAVQVLLSKGGVVSSPAEDAEERAALVEQSTEPATEPAESAPDEELCVECGASYPAGTSHRCGGEIAPSVYQRVPACTDCAPGAGMAAGTGGQGQDPRGDPQGRSPGETTAEEAKISVDNSGGHFAECPRNADLLSPAPDLVPMPPDPPAIQEPPKEPPPLVSEADPQGAEQHDRPVEGFVRGGPGPADDDLPPRTLVLDYRHKPDKKGR